MTYKIKNITNITVRRGGRVFLPGEEVIIKEDIENTNILTCPFLLITKELPDGEKKIKEKEGE